MHFRSCFFVSLKLLAKANIFLKNAMPESGRADIFLPCGTYMFLHVHYFKLYKEYDVIHVSENELDNTNVNHLHSATESQNHKELASHFDVTTNHQEMYISCCRAKFWIIRKIG